MRLVRFVLGLAMFGLLTYVAIAVPLGSKTLWQHLRAIAGSKESKELVDEVKQKASRMLHEDAGPAKGKGSDSGSGDELSADERRALRKLIKKKLQGAEAN